MKKILTYTLVALALAGGPALEAKAQKAAETSRAGSVKRQAGPRDRNRKKAEADGPRVTDRMQSFYSADNSSVGEADVQWMRVIYRQIDLDKDANAPLYFPEEPVDGQENLFRIIMRLLANNQVPAYEYLDGREIFNDKYQVKVKDVLDRFHILHTDAKGSTERNPRFVIDESDVPANEVLSYYVVERWEYDTRGNRMKTHVEAICPVLHRSGDFGGEAVKYPMFWVKFDDLRPHLAQQAIFVNDDNNLPTCTYDDFFNLTMYDGEIYKTRNLKNKSMMQLYPDPDDRKRAQDSIQARLDSWEKKLWVPSREEVIAAREAREAAADSTATVAAAGSDNGKTSVKRSTRRSTKRSPARQSEPKKEKKSTVKESKIKSNSSSNAARSVRRRKR